MFRFALLVALAVSIASTVAGQYAPLIEDNTAILDVPGRKDVNPSGWGDSYSVGSSCYCKTNYDHHIDVIPVSTPLGNMTVKQACTLLGPGPGSTGRPRYNDVQCGHGPANDAGDEDTCPGRIEYGKTGCKYIGPKWNFSSIKLPTKAPISIPVNMPVAAPVKSKYAPLLEDNTAILDVPGRSDVNPSGWGDSYSVGGSCFCKTNFDHHIDVIPVSTPLGNMTVKQACTLLGPGPGSDRRPRYNDVQCGHGPANDAGDEDTCPGRIEYGKTGCKYIGPKWNFAGIMIPAKAPTEAPLRAPTKAPMKAPVKVPVPVPVPVRVPEPTPVHVKAPVATNTGTPYKQPTLAPTKQSTRTPSKQPTLAPTKQSTRTPSKKPTFAPTKQSTRTPSKQPTLAPAKLSTRTPTKQPGPATQQTTRSPTVQTTRGPTKQPTYASTKQPTGVVSQNITRLPTKQPTLTPSKQPKGAAATNTTSTATNTSDIRKTRSPTRFPTATPKAVTNNAPTGAQMKKLTKMPTRSPSNQAPIKRPTLAPVRLPVTLVRPPVPVKAPTGQNPTQKRISTVAPAKVVQPTMSPKSMRKRTPTAKPLTAAAPATYPTQPNDVSKMAPLTKAPKVAGAPSAPRNLAPSKRDLIPPQSKSPTISPPATMRRTKLCRLIPSSRLRLKVAFGCNEEK